MKRKGAEEITKRRGRVPREQQPDGPEITWLINDCRTPLRTIIGDKRMAGAK